MSDTERLPESLHALLAQLDSQGIRDHRRYQMVRNYLNFRAREKGIPISGSFELTPLCNLDCRMCYVHLNRDQMKDAQLMTTDEWKNLMGQAVDAGMMYARLTGGECLTYPGFRDLYLYLRERGVETAILSNGLLMDAEMIAFLKENPPSGVQVTLYGADEEAYERVTGRRAFQTVAGNLLAMKAAGLPLSIAVTPNAFMRDGEEIIRLVHSWGLPVSINAGLMSPREETGRERLDADLECYVSMLRLWIQLYGGEPPIQCDEEELPDAGGTGERRYGLRCGAGRSTFGISWDGRMRPCNTFPCEPVDVRALGFNEAWRRVNAIAESFPLPAECAGCQYESGCKHCISEHASGAPVGHASPAVCAWARRMRAEGLFQQKK